MSATLNDPRIGNGMRAQLALRRKRLDAGAKQIGWKVGFGAPAAMEKLKLTAPLVGFLLDSAILPDGAAVSLKGWQKPVAETEIAVYIGHDIPGNADRETVRSAIAALGPAIELADIDVAMDFDSMLTVGSRLGTGTPLLLDDKTCPVGLTLNMMQFFAQESCGFSADGSH